MGIVVPTLHHILYVESDAVAISRYGFPCQEPRSIWVELEDDDQRFKLELRLKELHRMGRIKLFHVAACYEVDESDLQEVQEELDSLQCVHV